MEELNIVREMMGFGGAIAFALSFGVVVAVRKTGVDDVKERLVRVEADLKWIKKALGDKEEED